MKIILLRKAPNKFKLKIPHLLILGLFLVFSCHSEPVSSSLNDSVPDKCTLLKNNDNNVTLNCSKSLITKTASFSVNSSGGGCSGNIPMPPLLSMQPLRMTYAEANDGQPFGTSTNTNIIINYSIHQYLELSELSTPNQNLYRRLQFYPTPSSSNAAWVNTVSISECPGDFNEESATCVVVADPGSFSQMFISTDPNAPVNYCVIEPNKSYYLNLIHDQFPFDSNQGRCAFTNNQTCAIFFNEVSDNNITAIEPN